LFTHCGILTTYFAGRTFYLAELYPARVLVARDPGRPEVPGTMTLLSPHVAAFVDRTGNRVLFVDELPGALQHAVSVFRSRYERREPTERRAIRRAPLAHGSHAGAVLHFTALPPAGCD
jgi:hypothetical protein